MRATKAGPHTNLIKQSDIYIQNLSQRKSKGLTTELKSLVEKLGFAVQTKKAMDQTEFKFVFFNFFCFLLFKIFNLSCQNL